MQPRPFRVGYANSSFEHCSVCTKESNMIRTGELQVVKVLGSDVKRRHWECVSRTMSNELARLYPTGNEIKGYSKLNQPDQEKVDELLTKFRRPPPEEGDGVNSWVRETSNAVQGPLESDKASTDFSEPNHDWPGSRPSRPQAPAHPNRNTSSSIASVLGLELQSAATSATLRGPASATNGVSTVAQRSAHSAAADLAAFKANVGVAAAKIEVAKAQVNQELAKRKLLERQIALRTIRRRLKAESTRVPQVASVEENKVEDVVEGESGGRYADAEVQTEEEVKAPVKGSDELDEDDDEILLADSDIAIAKAEILVAEAGVLWEEAKLRLLQREIGR